MWEVGYWKLHCKERGSRGAPITAGEEFTQRTTHPASAFPWTAWPCHQHHNAAKGKEQVLRNLVPEATPAFLPKEKYKELLCCINSSQEITGWMRPGKSYKPTINFFLSRETVPSTDVQHGSLMCERHKRESAFGWLGWSTDSYHHILIPPTLRETQSPWFKDFLKSEVGKVKVIQCHPTNEWQSQDDSPLHAKLADGHLGWNGTLLSPLMLQDTVGRHRLCSHTRPACQFHDFLAVHPGVKLLKPHWASAMK